LGQLQVVARHTDTSPSSCYEPVLIPGYSKGQVCTVNGRCNLGSVNAPPPLEHRDPGVGWSCIAPESKFSYCFRTGKAQATSSKPQASSLTKINKGL